MVREEEIGTYHNGMLATSVTLDTEATSELRATSPLNEKAYLRQQSRQRKKVVTLYSKGFTLQTTENGGWELYDEGENNILSNESSSADHLRDLGIAIGEA